MSQSSKKEKKTARPDVAKRSHRWLFTSVKIVNDDRTPCCLDELETPLQTDKLPKFFRLEAWKQIIQRFILFCFLGLSLVVN